MNRFEQSTKKFLGLVILVAVFWMFGKMIHFDEQVIRSWLEPYPLVISGLIYVLLFSITSVTLWVTKDLFMFVGAIAFGIVGSTMLTWLGEVINAFILFTLSRKLGREFVEKKMSGRFKNLDKRLATTGMRDLLLLRAVVLVPYRFLDLGYGLTDISFRRYILAVMIGSWPRIFMRQVVAFYVFKAAGDLDHLMTEFKATGNIAPFLDYAEPYLVFIQAHPEIWIGCLLYIILTLFLIRRLVKIIGGV